MRFKTGKKQHIFFHWKKIQRVWTKNKKVMAFLKKVVKSGKMSVYGRDWFNGLIGSYVLLILLVSASSWWCSAMPDLIGRWVVQPFRQTNTGGFSCSPLKAVSGTLIIVLLHLNRPENRSSNKQETRKTNNDSVNRFWLVSVVWNQQVQ